MPTIELTINGKPQRVEVGDNATAADIDEIASQLSAGGGAAPPAPQEPPKAEESGWSRAGSYALNRGRELVESMQNLQGDITQAITGRKMFPEERTIGQRVGDVLTVGGTIAAPEIAAIGTAAGATARGLGAPEPVAQGIDIGTQLLTGGVQAVRGIRQAIRAPAQAAEAARAAQAVEGVTSGVTEAAQTEKAAAAIKELQTATPKEAGTAIRETYPGAEAARRSAFQEGTYDKIAAYAKAKGLAATNDNAVGQTLAKSLTSAEDEWGDLARTAESKQVRLIQEQLASGGHVEWEDLDKAEKALQRINGPSSVRKAIADAKKGLLEGTPAAKALESANQQWRLAIRPAKDIAATIDNAESPVQAFQKVVGSGKDPHRLEFVQKVLVTGGQAEKWSNVVGGFFTDMAQKAKGDPTKMAKLWDTVRPEVRAVIDPDGVAAQAFADLRQAGAREFRELPALPEASTLKKVLPYAQSGLVTGGAAFAANKFYHGDWWGGLRDLGIGAALANPRIAMSAARPLARTGAAVLGSPPGRHAIGAYEQFLNAPSELEQASPAGRS